MGQHLGEFEQLLLFALLDLDHEADGAAVRRRIEARTGRVVSPGAIYTAMDRLSGRGFVSARIQAAPPEQGGRRRKYYALESPGARALERSFRVLSQMAEGLAARLSAAAAGGTDAGPHQ